MRGLMWGWLMGGLVLGAGCMTSRGAGVENRVTFDAVPQTIGEFVSIRDAMAVHPEGGAACLVLAGLLYAQDEALGLQAITAMLDPSAAKGPAVWEGLGPVEVDVARFHDQWSKAASHDHVPRSYVQGTSPDQGYALGQPPYVVRLKARDEEKGTAQVLVYSTGADHARAVTLKRNDKGIWQATEWNALLADVKPAKAAAK